MKYEINTELTEDEDLHNFELRGDESLEYGGTLCDSLSHCVSLAEEETGMTLEEIARESNTGGLTVKVVGKRVWINIIP